MGELANRILELKEKRRAVILAHYYQIPEIQELADHVGDSLALAKYGRDSDADVLVVCGVHFMGETAKILDPHKKVIIPDANAGCSLADSCPPEAFKEFIDQNPGHEVVTYVNCSAEIKAMSDRVCTSSNAREVIRSIPEEKPIIFAPDKNLGFYLIKETGRDMVLWDGACTVHEAFNLDKLIKVFRENPGAELIAHPESETHVLRIAHHIGSTSSLLKYVEDSPKQEFIVATEGGILHEMKKRVPHKKLIPAPSAEDNTCACSECAFMKMNTLQKLHDCLKYLEPEIRIPEEIRRKAYASVQRMLEPTPMTV